MVGGIGDTIFILQVLSDLPKVSQLASGVAGQTLPQALWHQVPCKHSSGSWCRARWGVGHQGAGASADDQCGSGEKFKTLTLPRKCNVLLLFLITSSPSRDTKESKPRLMTKKWSSRRQTTELCLLQQSRAAFTSNDIGTIYSYRGSYKAEPIEPINLHFISSAKPESGEKVLKMNQMFSFHNLSKTCRFNNSQVSIEHLVLPVIYTLLKSSPSLFKLAK